MKRDYGIAIALAAATAGVLVAMVIVTVATGASQEAFEHVTAPADYARDIVAGAGPLRLLMGLDVAFLALYTAFFATLASILRRAGAGRVAGDLALLAIAAMLGVAVLDIIEDHHILALLRTAELGEHLESGALAFQQTLSSTKFSLSYVALVAFGLAIPRTSKLAWVVSAFLVGGTLANAVADYAIPPAAHDAIDQARWLGFLAGFGLAGAWLVQARRASADRA